MRCDPVCPSCRRVTSVERLPRRYGRNGLDLYCAACSLVFSDPNDDGPKEAA